MPSCSEPEPGLQGLHFDKPIPRPPKSPSKTSDIRSRNRRREYIERNPKYFNNAEHELAGLFRRIFLECVIWALTALPH